MTEILSFLALASLFGLWLRYRDRRRFDEMVAPMLSIGPGPGGGIVVIGGSNRRRGGSAPAASPSALWPNRPTGGEAWTEQLYLDGSTIEPGARYLKTNWDPHWDLVADAGNPSGSGQTRRAQWSNPEKGYGIAEDNLWGTQYAEVYYALEINFTDFDDDGCKLFWLGTAQDRNNQGSATQIYQTREPGGVSRLTNQNVVSEILIQGGNLTINNSTYHLLELYLVANSSPGTADGTAQFWLDETLIGTNNAVLWADTGQGIGFDGDVLQMQSNDVPATSEEIRIRRQAIFVRGTP